MSEKSSLQKSRSPPPYTPENSGELTLQDVSPPSYSSQQPVGLDPPVSLPAVPKVDLSKYKMPGAIISEDQTTVVKVIPAESLNIDDLLKFIREQIVLPPRPEIRITRKTMGEHKDMDFNLRLNLMSEIIPPPGREWVVETISQNDGDVYLQNEPLFPNSECHMPITLDHWVQLFISDPKTPRAMTIEKIVDGWDTRYLEKKIRELVKSTIGDEYGLSIKFPLSNSKVIIYVPEKDGSLLSSIRTFVREEVIGWGRPEGRLYYAKDYRVVNVKWKYQSRKPKRSFKGRVLRDEEAWWLDWQETIWAAIINRTHGWVSPDDLLESKMCGESMADGPNRKWWDNWKRAF